MSYNFTDRNNMVGKTPRQTYFTELQDAVNDLDDKKIDKVDGKDLSTNDYTTAEKNKLAGIATGATKAENSTTNGNVKINGLEVNVYTHPSGSNPHGTTKSDVGLGNVDNIKQAPSSRNITSGNGLSGGGDLSADRTITLGTPSTITNSTTNNVTSTSHTHALTLPDASTSEKGIVQLSSATNSTSNTLGATASAVKSAYDLANHTHPYAPISHTTDTNNPHSVTKSQIGLSSVQNYGIATQAEAEAGTSSTKYMTPQRTQQAINKNLSGLNNLENELETHKAEYESFKNNVEGFRIIEEQLEYFDGTEWHQMKSNNGYPVGAVTNFSANPDNKQVTLTWTDPPDVTIKDSLGNDVHIAKWKGTKILRKLGNYPANENDGVLVVDSGIRNQYQINGFVDTGLTNGTTYYYSAFPYTLEDMFDKKTDISAILIEQHIYGVRIDKNNSNPETRVTYIGDAVGFTPMRGNNGNLQWGSWQGTDLLKDIKPCVLQNLGGGNAQVRYYLNPNNYTQKEDGTSAILNGNDGDVMIEIPERWWKFTNEGTAYTVEVSDKPFSGAVKLAHEIENGYNQVSFYALLLTQCIVLILLKSTDTQSALGRGYVDGNSAYASTGNTNTRGLFYGTANGTQQMKFLGMEDYWGNKLWWVDGLFYNANRDILIGSGNFNDTGNGYTNHGHSGFASNGGGYINAVQGGNHTGFTPKTVGGSATTFYTDYGYVGGGRMPYFGGHRAYGSGAGGFHLASYMAAYSDEFIGARLCFKKGDKLYIGAYLGTTISGRLRSVSGTSEPAGSKTIGAFRTEAKANNN